MKLKRDLHLEVSRKLQNSVSVKVFAFRADRDAERVCLGALHMPESYMRVFRSILEYGSIVLGARVVCAPLRRLTVPSGIYGDLRL